VKLDLTADQELLGRTTRRYLAERCPPAVVRALEGSPTGFERDYWRQGAELGWTSLLVKETHGGGSVSGAGLADLAVVAEELGRAVAPGPLVGVNVVGEAVSDLGRPDQRAEVLPGLLAGDAVAAWSPNLAWDGSGVTAQPAGDDWILAGSSGPVEGGVGAELLLVAADTPAGPTQFLVPAATPGLTVTARRSLDLVRRFATLRFDGCRLPGGAVLGAPGAAGAAVERQLQVALVLQVAESSGAADRVLEFTARYAADRYSFGRPLSSYQALKHRFADMKMWLEACHATATAAAEAVAARSGAAAELVSVAKSWVADRTPAIIQDCVQMHGGIGVTWDHDLHLYLRRVTVNAGLHGTVAQHRERLAALLAV